MSFCVAAVFSSNMVLQRDKVIRVFGEGENGAEVVVSLKTSQGICSRNGKVCGNRWLVELPPHAAEDNCMMTVTCGSEQKVMTNLAIGEVWLCGGQSNMEMELQNIKDGRKHLQEDRNPNVRFYYTQKNGYMDETFFANERMMVWKEFSEEAAACWSGVGYLFGKRLAEHLGVTVGLIGCNWGGTSASAWMSKDSILAEDALKIYWEEYEAKVRGRSIEEQEQEYRAYEEYRDAWNVRCGQCYAENPNIEWDEVLRICGDSRWPGPINCCNPYRPAGLYDTMVRRVAPYSMRGFLFYQGESDDHRPDTYERLLKRMVGDWRREWYEEDMPFLMVQLPTHQYKGDPDYKHWCKIREAQLNVFKTVKNTGLAVIIDSGEFNEIHPKDKEPVGERLYLQALHHVYGELEPWEANAPIYQDSFCEGKKLHLRFRYADKGFRVNTEVAAEPVGFEVAGADGVYYSAKATLCGSDIFVEAEQVEVPVKARYLWTNYGDVNLYGANGVPVSPFRTDSREEEVSAQVNTEIKQVMEL